MKRTTEILFSIQNADAEKRLVSGVSDSGEPNASGLLLDYATSKPLLIAWSENIEKKTKGASKGVLRVMHQLETVGKIVSLEFDDDKRQILVTVHVSDDTTWQKIQGGEYTGFSWWWRTQGMPWKNEEATKTYGKPIFSYTGKPIELSIVDAACVPGSDFTEIQNADYLEDEDMDEPTNQAETESQSVVPDADVKNGMYAAGRFGEVLESLHWLIKAAEAEEKREGQDATIPEELRAGLRALAEPVAKYMVAQVKEIAGGEDVDMLHVADDDDFADLDDVKNADAPSFGSGKIAHRATVRAVVSGDTKHHEAAASFHKEAAKVQGRSGKKTMEAYHKGMAKIHSNIKNCATKNAESGDVQNADKLDPIAELTARVAALEAAKDVKNSEDKSGDSVLATLAAAAAPTTNVKNAEDGPDANRVVTKDEDAGVEVKNAETMHRAEAQRIAALPEPERAAAIAVKIFQGAASR